MGRYPKEVKSVYRRGSILPCVRNKFGVTKKDTATPDEVSGQCKTLLKRVCYKEGICRDTECTWFYSNLGGDWVFLTLAGVPPHSLTQLAPFKRIGTQEVKREEASHFNQRM